MQTLEGLEVVRAAPTVVRAAQADGGPRTMEVRFSPFNVWYEIDSYWEGRFLERTERGAFAKTIQESRDRIKPLFQHGFDPQIGQKVLGSVTDLREDPDTAIGEVALFDTTTYVRDLLPGLEAGAYGASMRMRVIKDEWDDEPGRSEHNPDGIPERTIKEVRLVEFGPVTFPANPDSSASVRSGTDAYMTMLRSVDPARVEDLMRARNSRTSPHTPAGTATEERDEAARTTTTEPATSHSSGLTPAQRRELLLTITLGRGT